MAVSPSLDHAFGSNGQTTISDQADVQQVMDALDDADCREILEVTEDESLAASDISERCDLPLSTTYRKLDLLADAGLLAERTRIRPSGTHASEYRRLFEELTVSMDATEGTTVQITYRETVENQHALVVDAD